MLKFENIGFTIQKHDVLRDISFSIDPGEIVTIIGESGAGKSTIFKLLIGELRPTAGRIMVDEVSLGEIAPRDIQRYRRQIGVVFQDFKLLPHKTVFENVAFALEVCDKELDIDSRVPELLEMVGLSGKEHQFPSTLSGGEKTTFGYCSCFDS
jgi:cell division transport system ATP-binding protein